MRSGLILTTWGVDAQGANVPSIMLLYPAIWLIDYTDNYPPNPNQLVIAVGCDEATAALILANEVVLTTDVNGDPAMLDCNEANWQEVINEWLN